MITPIANDYTDLDEMSKKDYLIIENHDREKAFNF